MTETQTIAQKLGIDFGITIEQRIAGAEKVGAVAELGKLTDTPTPHIDTAYVLVKLLEQT